MTAISWCKADQFASDQEFRGALRLAEAQALAVAPQRIAAFMGLSIPELKQWQEAGILPRRRRLTRQFHLSDSQVVKLELATPTILLSTPFSSSEQHGARTLCYQQFLDGVGKTSHEYMGLSSVAFDAWQATRHSTGLRKARSPRAPRHAHRAPSTPRLHANLPSGRRR
jgi:hypothetical protein